MSELLDKLYPHNPLKITEEQEKLGEMTFDSIKSIKRELINVVYPFISLFYLSLVMVPHAIASRYPDCEVNPLKFYNKKLPLLQLFDEVVGVMDKTVYRIDSFTTTVSIVKHRLNAQPITENNLSLSKTTK